MGGKESARQKLVVRKDPNSAGTEADVAAATKLSVAIYHDTTPPAGMINRARVDPQAARGLRKMLRRPRPAAADLEAAEDLEKKVRASRTSCCSRHSPRPT